MQGLLNALQLGAYTAGAAYVGWLVGNNQCPAHANFYLCLYGPAVADTISGFFGGLRGAPYHSNLIGRLVSRETPEDDHSDLTAAGEALKGATVGAASGLAVGLTAYACGYSAGDLISRLF